MTDISSVVRGVEGLEFDEKLRFGALLLVRYCNIHHDPRFSPWFEQDRDALARVSEVALKLARAETGQVDLDGPYEALDQALEASDPEGPPFEAEIVDHMVFATEVLDFLRDPGEVENLTCALERADELAEAHYEMIREVADADTELVDFSSMEAELRGLDMLAFMNPEGALVRSESFSQAYSSVIRSYYSDADAGISD
ncbi:hypothetical protein [Streptomyces sp. RKAG293]|uniref:hypothetical protein n=1 Tax=Streptomyces sp. RKAG293 TaxID=2893403 RepID=UPI00203429A9|nr:hypothetical protein [Streptomyces sp. RKAG293]MCM2418124.1 hypothetical protein [Streptomyces sp. RKAG293]